MNKGDQIYPFHKKINFKSTQEFKSKIFGSIKKACYEYYKFDSKLEKKFAGILEKENKVIKWMRPAPRQLNITWDNDKNYEPDFIVETKDTIYIIEIKARVERDDRSVKLKKQAAIKFVSDINKCKDLHAKKWEYILIRENEIKLNSTFLSLINASR